VAGSLEATQLFEAVVIIKRDKQLHAIEIDRNWTSPRPKSPNVLTLGKKMSSIGLKRGSKSGIHSKGCKNNEGV